jgi:hypothetical protein
LRTSYVAIVLVAVLLFLVGFTLTRPELSTRQVRYNGQLCTEYFDRKDGMERRTECPSRGGESYADTAEVRQYPPNFPVKRVERAS